MKHFGILMAVLVGALLPLQALLNARLGQLTHGPLFASLCSFVVGTLALGLVWLALRPGNESWTALAQPAWWAWTGGLIGALFVVAATGLVTRLGAASLICLVVLGQLVGSLALDHFGVLHPRKPVDLLRVAGVCLVAMGALLVVRPWEKA